MSTMNCFVIAKLYVIQPYENNTDIQTVYVIQKNI